MLHNANQPLTPFEELAVHVIDAMTGARIAARGYLTAWIRLHGIDAELKGLESYEDLLIMAGQMLNHFAWQVSILEQMTGSPFHVREAYIEQQKRALELMQRQLDHLREEPDNSA